MKNIETSVGVISMQEKKEDVGGEKNKVVTNFVRFYLKEAPRFEMSAMGLWRENSSGEKVGYVDIYFFPSMARKRYDDRWRSFQRGSEEAEKAEDMWKMLGERIEALEDIYEIIRCSKWVGL